MLQDKQAGELQGRRGQWAGGTPASIYFHGTWRHLETGKIDGTRSPALRGATGVKNGVKSGGFWQPLSQDVALCCKSQKFVESDETYPRDSPHTLQNAENAL